MQGDLDNRSVMHSLRAVGGGAAAHVTGAPQEPPRMVPHGSVEPCTCYRRASASAAMTARRTLAACGAARYSES